jgi:hypothetical protein
MNIPKSKIAILSTVINFELYEKTSQLFPEGIQKYIIDGRNRMYGIDSIIYMVSKFKNLGIEWLIMADEDVIFYNPEQVFSIVEKMNDENYTVAGVRDGGVIAHRKHNPNVINTFFSVLNIKTVLDIWDKKAILSNQYTKPNEFNDFGSLPYTFNTDSLFEPYYCFYLWLRRNNKKFLFLDVKMKDDAIANEVLFNNKTLLCHTWYARRYGKDPFQTQRINNYLPQLNLTHSTTVKPIIFNDKFYLIKKPSILFHLVSQKIYKIFQKLVN